MEPLGTESRCSACEKRNTWVHRLMNSKAADCLPKAWMELNTIK